MYICDHAHVYDIYVTCVYFILVYIIMLDTGFYSWNEFID